MTQPYTPPSNLAAPSVTPVNVTVTWDPSLTTGTAGVVLLLHFDGNYLDSSAVANVMTHTGVSITASSKFGSGAAQFTANTSPSSQSVVTPCSGPVNIFASNGDFTVEGWVRIDSGSNVQFPVVDYGNDQVSFNDNNGFIVTVALDSGTLTYNMTVTTGVTDSVSHSPWGGDTITNIPSTGLGVWMHFAVVRASGIMRCYTNGAPSATTRSWQNYNGVAGSIAIGRTADVSGGQALASVDDIRVTTSAVYTGAFTRPASAFPNPGPPQGYIVYRDGVEIGQVTTINVTLFVDLQVVQGATYSYTIAAQDGSNHAQSDPSAPLLVTIPFGPQTVFGGFAPAAAFPPVMVANLAGIKPRIYSPIENNTVRTKQ